MTDGAYGPANTAQQEAILRGAARLRAGGIVAFPTETVYGLGADARDAAAVARVFALKGRPANNPLIVHVTGGEMAGTVACWSGRAERVARALWPGPLSLVLPHTGGLPQAVTAGGPTVAVRSPAHPTALALLFHFGGPMVGPSANRSGQVSPTTAEHVRAAFDEHQVLVLEGGRCTTGIESTVLWLADGPARILRPGAIGPDAISEALGEAVEPFGPAPSAASGPMASPGLLERHYAPRTEALRFAEHQWPDVLAAAAGRRIVVISHWPRPVPSPHELIELSPEARLYAANLYAALHHADARAELIALELPPSGGEVSEPDDAAIWTAVHDRIRRATRPV